MLVVSRRLKNEIKLSPVRGYKLALYVAGCHPSTLSKLLNGAERVRPNDPRIVAIGARLGLSPEACFEEQREGDSTA